LTSRTKTNLREYYAELRELENQLRNKLRNGVVFIASMKEGIVRQCDPEQAAIAILDGEFRLAEETEIKAYLAHQEAEAERLAERAAARPFRPQPFRREQSQRKPEPAPKPEPEPKPRTSDSSEILSLAGPLNRAEIAILAGETLRALGEHEGSR